MSYKNKQEHEFSIIINIVIFLTVISIVGLTRVFVIYFKNGQNLNLSYLESANLENINNEEKENIILTSSINNSYDVDVYFGNKTKNYVEAVNANILTNNEKINDLIIKLNESLKKYPSDLIKEIENKGYTVSIFLVDSFKNDNIALANRTANKNFRIYLSYSQSIDRAFHHELYHVLDYYLKLENNEKLLYINWNNNNPKGFIYEEDVNKLTSEYVYKDNEYGAFFVTTYAKYNEKEDRAETFANMMTDTNKKTYYQKNEKIHNKMVIIKNTLYNVFKSVNSTKDIKYFERYL